MNKYCNECKQTLSISNFTARADRKHGLDDLRKYSAKCKACQSLNAKLKFFGISKDEYLKIKLNSLDCCEICGVTDAEALKNNEKCKHSGLYIDHCHTTKKVRGFLCHNCNLVLGQAKDNIDILTSAIEYLKRHEIV